MWRFIHGWTVCYILLFATIAVTPISWTRTGLKILFPEFSEKSVIHEGPDCDLTPSRLWEHLSGYYFICHVTGYAAKMLLLRSWHMVLMYAFFFELLELTLQFLIPAFQECWWDSTIVDYCGSNLLGTFIGAILLPILRFHTFEWKLKSEVKQSCPVIKRLLLKFVPKSYVTYTWNPSQSLRGYCLQWLVVVLFLMLEINTFLICHLMHIPINHY